MSGVLGGEIQLTDRLRADLGVRVEYDYYQQNSENTSKFDIDGNPVTTYDNETFGNGSFRHFTQNLTDWAGSLGLNYRLNQNWGFYAAGSRGYKMPELDALLNATAQQQVDVAEAKEVQSVEGGVKAQIARGAITVSGFYVKGKNNTGQGLELVNGVTTWVIRQSPDVQSYGAELEAVFNPLQGLLLQGNATVMQAELGGNIDSLKAGRVSGSRCPRRPWGMWWGSTRCGGSSHCRSRPTGTGWPSASARTPLLGRWTIRRCCRPTTTSTSAPAS